uniref:Uncharacterized protein n=1 Tax=Romanomermis culicivorax TaxID=13658 RepID=A0A915KF63_ROMCU
MNRVSIDMRKNDLAETYCEKCSTFFVKQFKNKILEFQIEKVHFPDNHINISKEICFKFNGRTNISSWIYCFFHRQHYPLMGKRNLLTMRMHIEIGQHRLVTFKMIIVLIAN